MTFQEIVAAFRAVSPQEVEEQVAADKDVILFVGRASCPYCQRFAPKLARVVKEDGLAINFINSENLSQLADIQALRAKYGMKTVPAFLVAKAGQVKVVCDSSLSEDDIRAFIA